MLSEVIDPRVRQGIPWPVPAGPYRHQFAPLPPHTPSQRRRKLPWPRSSYPTGRCIFQEDSAVPLGAGRDRHGYRGSLVGRVGRGLPRLEQWTPGGGGVRGGRGVAGRGRGCARAPVPAARGSFLVSFAGKNSILITRRAEGTSALRHRHKLGPAVSARAESYARPMAVPRRG